METSEDNNKIDFVEYLVLNDQHLMGERNIKSECSGRDVRRIFHDKSVMNKGNFRSACRVECARYFRNPPGESPMDTSPEIKLWFRQEYSASSRR